MAGLESGQGAGGGGARAGQGDGPGPVRNACRGHGGVDGLGLHLTEQGDVAVPAGLQPHLLREDPAPQLVLLREVNKANTGRLQVLDQLNHILKSTVHV